MQLTSARLPQPSHSFHHSSRGPTAAPLSRHGPTRPVRPCFTGTHMSSDSTGKPKLRHSGLAELAMCMLVGVAQTPVPPAPWPSMLGKGRICRSHCELGGRRMPTMCLHVRRSSNPLCRSLIPAAQPKVGRLTRASARSTRPSTTTHRFAHLQGDPTSHLGKRPPVRVRVCVCVCVIGNMSTRAEARRLMALLADVSVSHVLDAQRAELPTPMCVRTACAGVCCLSPKPPPGTREVKGEDPLVHASSGHRREHRQHDRQPEVPVERLPATASSWGESVVAGASVEWHLPCRRTAIVVQRVGSRSCEGRFA